MLCTKSKLLKILDSMFYLLIILFSVFIIFIKLYKLNWLKILNSFFVFSVQISVPEIEIYKNKNYTKNNFFSKISESEDKKQDEKIKINENFQNENKSCFSADISESYTSCKILETQFGKSGIKYKNFYIKNKTGEEINFDKYLDKKFKIFIKNKKNPLVLIYHTHTSESYLEKNYEIIPKDFYARTQDNNKNIVAIGKKLAETLKKNGISVVHDTTLHDFPNYNGAYLRSAKTLKKYINKYSQIPIIIDLHRDSMGENKTGRIKPVFMAKNNKKAAQIMFVCGCGVNKLLKFPNWEKNLNLALNLQNMCEEKFPGFTRELLIKNAVYNQNLTSNSILIEIGSDMNTLEEASFSAQMLGESLCDFLNKFSK